MSSNTQDTTDRARAPFGTNTTSTGYTGKLALIIISRELCLIPFNKLRDSIMIPVSAALKTPAQASVPALAVITPLVRLNMTRLALARKVRRATLSRSSMDVVKEVLVLALGTIKQQASSIAS